MFKTQHLFNTSAMFSAHQPLDSWQVSWWHSIPSLKVFIAQQY